MQHLLVTAKRPMVVVLDFSIVALSSLPLPKFTRFGLNPVKSEQC